MYIHIEDCNAPYLQGIIVLVYRHYTCTERLKLSSLLPYKMNLLKSEINVNTARLLLIHQVQLFSECCMQPDIWVSGILLNITCIAYFVCLQDTFFWQVIHKVRAMFFPYFPLLYDFPLHLQ